MIYVIPLIIALVLITAMIKKLPSYELFIDGAEEGMKIVSGIFPPLVAVLPPHICSVRQARLTL